MRTGRIRAGLAFLIFVSTLTQIGEPSYAQTNANARCFAETDLCISGRIRVFWEQNGGLSAFGLPITAQQAQAVEGRVLQVQWFERNRLELHPENKPPYDVLLGRLGADRLAQLRRDWRTLPKSKQQPNCRYFPETEHNVCGKLLSRWRAGGIELDGQLGTSEVENLTLFGLPLGDARTEQLSDGKRYTVQWFERARIERHPENAPPYDVLLGLLGSEILASSKAQPAPTIVTTPAPTAVPTLLSTRQPAPTSPPAATPQPTPPPTSPLQRNDPPPTGIATQLDFIGGCCPPCFDIEIHPKSEPAIVIYENYPETEIVFCYVTFPDQRAQVSIRRPDGIIVSPTSVFPGSGTYSIRQGYPFGRYTVTVKQGPFQTTASILWTQGDMRRMEVSPDCGRPGDTFQFSLTGFEPYQRVRLFLYRFDSGFLDLAHFATELPTVLMDVQGAGTALLTTHIDDLSNEPTAHSLYAVFTQPAVFSYRIIGDRTTFLDSSEIGLYKGVFSLARFCQ